jgi:hypothetical protein
MVASSKIVYDTTLKNGQKDGEICAANINRLMLFEERVTACENHTEHTNTLRSFRMLKQVVRIV